jgi:DNA-binding NarL/FixJ family response regulator
MAVSRKSSRDQWKSVVLSDFFRISPQPESPICPCAPATISIGEHGMMNTNSDLTLKFEFVHCKGGELETSSSRVLVVEDNEPFRRFVCSTLGKRPELHIVCEVSDGLEAVQRAEELHPDLIVLDIGLPSLNGIEAARQIRKLSPESKILFLSQETSTDLVQEALGLGAMGYVAKASAGSDLLAAVEAVSQGGRFVSAGLASHVPADLAEEQVPKHLQVLALAPEATDD